MKYEQVPNGYTVFLKERGQVFMQKGDNRQGFSQIICSDEDMLNGNVEYMTKNGYTREEVKK